MHCITAKGQMAIRKGMVEAYRLGMSVERISEKFNVARSTVHRWIHRASLENRSFVPRYQPRKVPAAIEEHVRQVRLQTHAGPWRIGILLRMPTSTVYKILRRLGINRLAPDVPAPPTPRYEKKHPGELVHVDVKKLGLQGLAPQPRRFQAQLAYQRLHVMLDDCSRVVFTAIYPDETAASAAEFLERGIAYFASLGIVVHAVLSDNGAAYLSEQWRDTCQLLGVQHLRTRPRRPQTNGKCERWNRTVKEEALRGRLLPGLEARATVIDNFAAFYNTRRPHKALHGKTPLQRLVACSVPV